MATPNKETKLKWLNAALNRFHDASEKGALLFTCNIVEEAAGGAALRWYDGVLHLFLEHQTSSPRATSVIEMFHDEKHQSVTESRSIEARSMWLFMLKTLIEDGQL